MLTKSEMLHNANKTNTTQIHPKSSLY